MADKKNLHDLMKEVTLKWTRPACQRVFPDVPLPEMECEVHAKPLPDCDLKCIPCSYPRGYEVKGSKVIETQYFPPTRHGVQAIRHLMFDEHGEKNQMVYYECVTEEHREHIHEVARREIKGWDDTQELQAVFGTDDEDEDEWEEGEDYEDVPFVIPTGGEDIDTSSDEE